MTTPRRLTCFCYFGGERMTIEDGSGKYVGGVSEATIIEEGITFDALVEKVCSFMDIEREGKSFFYNTWRDKSKHLRIRNDAGVTMLFELNQDDVDIFIEQESVPIPHPNQSSKESHLLSNSPPSIGGNGGGSFSTEGAVSGSHEMGLMALSKQRADDIITGEGQLFQNADEFKTAIVLYAVLNKFSFKYKDNSKKYYRLVCAVETCPWKLTASSQGTSELVRIISMNKDHLHTAQDDANYKAKLRAKHMGLLFREKLCSQPDMVPRTICKDFEMAFHTEVTYMQAWRTRERAREFVSGPAKKTYHLVPWLCERIVHSIPNSRAVWSSTDDGKFKQLFVAYGCSITGFLAGCRPMLFIDACFLTGPYRGNCLSAVAYDANDQLWPLAYGIVSSENYEDWLWFMQNLKEIVNDTKVVLVTDRNAGLLKAVKEVFGEEYNAWCFRHVKENYSRFANSKGFRANRKKTAMDLITEIGYARTDRLYNVHITSLQGLSPDLAKWVDENGPNHWANSLFPFRRWDKLYTNIAESFNSWILKERELDIIGFMKGHISKTTDMLLRRKLEAMKWTLPVGPSIEHKIKESQLKSRGLTSRPTSPSEFIVSDATFKTHAIKLYPAYCSCLEWQMKGIPCKHVVCAIEGTSHNIYDLVDPYFKIDMQMVIYQTVMSPVPMHDMPSPFDVGPFSVAPFPSQTADYVHSDGNLLDMVASSSSNPPVLLPPVTKRPAGRPKKKRIESQFQDKQTVLCSRCREAGHNRATCKSPLPG